MNPGRRNFHAVWPSLFATSMGLMAFLPTLALYVRDRFAIAPGPELVFWAGVIYGAAPFAAAVVGPVWGGLGDRVGKKPMAIRANLAIAAATALMPLAPTPLVLLLMRVVQGALAGYVAPAMALVSHGLPRADHGLVIARLQVAMAAGSCLGPLLGAAASHWFGRESPFWLTSALSFAAAVRLQLCAHEVPPDPADRPASFLREFCDSCRGLLANRVFAGLLVLVLLLRLGQNMMEPYVALFVRELGSPAWLGVVCGEPDLALELTVGVAFTVLALAQLALTPWWGRLADRHGPLRCLAVLGVMLGALLFASAAVATIDQFLVARSAAACVMAGSMTLAYAAASKRVVDERRTLAFSMIQSCMQLAFALGPTAGAAIAVADGGGHTDFRRVFVAAGACCLVAGAGMIWLRRRPANDPA